MEIKTWTVKELCVQFKRSPKTIYRMKADKRLIPIRGMRPMIFPDSEIQRLLKVRDY